MSGNGTVVHSHWRWFAWLIILATLPNALGIECRLDTPLIDSNCPIRKQGFYHNPELRNPSYKSVKTNAKGYYILPEMSPVLLQIFDPAVALSKGMDFSVYWVHGLPSGN